jgi:DNA repair exonuclease SbcCD ATPase subunit
MQVVSIRAENFKGLQLAEVKPRKTTTVIGGRNKQGKSSLLDAIASALGGKKLCPEQPIRTGQESAKVSVELDGDPARLIPPITVTREFYRKENGDIDSKLEIITKDGYKAPSPQTMLQDVCGRLGFDPEAFLRMDPKKQADILRELVGLDFTELDKQYKEIYDSRTILTREGKSLKGQLDGCKKHDDAPAEEVSVSALAAKLREIHAANAENGKQRDILRVLESKVKDAEKGIAVAEQRITDLEQQLAKAREQLTSSQAAHNDAINNVSLQQRLVNTLQDQSTTEIESQIANAEQINRKVRDNAKHAELAAAVTSKQNEWKQASEKLKAIEAQKQTMREAAKWPVPGLGYDETGVTYNRLPFAQASAYEQRKVAMGICVAMSPTLRFAFLKDGSLLDADGLIEFAELAAEKGVQLFVERVGKGSECNIIIENGLVESSDGENKP